MALGFGTPIVVKLDAAHQFHVDDYFTDKGLSGNKLEAAVHNGNEWYGIIDDVHSNLAVLWLMENKGSWKHYSWFVTVIARGHSVDRSR